jgi:Transposase, Mutator family
LEDVYPVVFLDCLVLKIREGGKVQRRAYYFALGVTDEIAAVERLIAQPALGWPEIRRLKTLTDRQATEVSRDQGAGACGARPAGR